MKSFAIATLLFISAVGSTIAQKINVLTEDGAWCWFSDPRAVYAGDNGLVVTGWVTSKGDIEVASLDPSSGAVQTQIIYPELQIDDHDNPAFVVLPDDRLLTMYAWHSGTNGVIRNTTTRPLDVNSFGENVVFKPKTEALLKKYVRETYTYANPHILSDEDNKLFSFGRWVGFKPNLITSMDNGKTWSDPRVVITSKELDTNNRPYVKYFSDGKSKIHLIFTDGHPAVEPLNSVYYCYYEKDAFWRADGSKICSVEDLPFTKEDASLVYKATEETGRAWIFDVVVDDHERPAIAYTRYPRVKTHDYHYAIYDKGKWVDHKVIYSGTWFPEDLHNERQKELNYSGGLTIDPTNANTLYMSHMVDGVFEISKGVSSDLGASWEITPITQESKYDNVRPYVPRYREKGDHNLVFWMQNERYIHYTDYRSRILYTRINP